MKPRPKLVFILMFVLGAIACHAQNNTPKPDNEFNLFLAGILLVFTCGMLGAAIVGAMAAALVIFFVFALISLGMLSASVAVGLYRRSASAGFKTFLYLLFGASCAVIGGIGMAFADAYFFFPGSTLLTAGIGALGGLAGGLLMAQFIVMVVRESSKYLFPKTGAETNKN